MLRKQYPLFCRDQISCQPMNLEQAALRDNEWVLFIISPIQESSFTSPRGRNLVKAVFKPVPRKEIDELVRRFRDSLEIASDGISGR